MDQELRRALRRVEPSPGFAGHVMARVEDAKVPPGRRPDVRRWLGLGLVASLVAASAAGWMHLVRRAEGQQARYDVELALRITTEKLQAVQSKVQARVAAVRDRF